MKLRTSLVHRMKVVDDEYIADHRDVLPDNNESKQAIERFSRDQESQNKPDLHNRMLGDIGSIYMIH